MPYLSRRTFLLGGAASASLQSLPLRAGVLESLPVVGNADVPPKAWLDPDGVARGYAVDGATVVLRRAGFLPSVQLYPWRRALAVAERGAALLLGILTSPERQQTFLFSEPYAEDEVMLVVRRGEAFAFSGPEDLAGHRVAHQGGAMFGPDWPAYLAAMSPVEIDSPVGRLRMLLAGHVDVAVLNPGGAALRLQCARAGLDPNQFELLPRPLARLGVHIGLPRAMRRSELLELINQAIRDLSADGTLSAIQAAYLPRPDTKPHILQAQQG